MGEHISRIHECTPYVLSKINLIQCLLFDEIFFHRLPVCWHAKCYPVCCCFCLRWKKTIIADLCCNKRPCFYELRCIIWVLWKPHDEPAHRPIQKPITKLPCFPLLRRVPALYFRVLIAMLTFQSCCSLWWPYSVLSTQESQKEKILQCRWELCYTWLLL